MAQVTQLGPMGTPIAKRPAFISKTTSTAGFFDILALQGIWLSSSVVILVAAKHFKSLGRTTSFKSLGRTTSFKSLGRTTSFKSLGR